MTTSPVVADIFHGKSIVPVDVDLSKSRVYLEVDELAPEAAANITVNGTYAGGFIGRPFRLEVTRLLRNGANSITISPFAPKSARLIAY